MNEPTPEIDRGTGARLTGLVNEARHLASANASAAKIAQQEAEFRVQQAAQRLAEQGHPPYSPPQDYSRASH